MVSDAKKSKRKKVRDVEPDNGHSATDLIDKSSNIHNVASHYAYLNKPAVPAVSARIGLF